MHGKPAEDFLGRKDQRKCDAWKTCRGFSRTKRSEKVRRMVNLSRIFSDVKIRESATHGKPVEDFLGRKNQRKCDAWKTCRGFSRSKRSEKVRRMENLSRTFYDVKIRESATHRKPVEDFLGRKNQRKCNAWKTCREFSRTKRSEKVRCMENLPMILGRSQRKCDAWKTCRGICRTKKSEKVRRMENLPRIF